MEGRKKYNATWMYNITDDRIGRRKGTASSLIFLLVFFFQHRKWPFRVLIFLDFCFIFIIFHVTNEKRKNITRT